jgi:DNA-binding NarL/FixJ family response regulator
MRSVLRITLTRQKAIRVEIVGEAADGDDAIAATAELHPDVVLMDVDMPCMNGIEATRQIASRFPTVYIIGWTSCDSANAEAMRAAGAADVLSKDAGLAKLVEALRVARP